MNIGALAKQAAVGIQTIRYYERVGLIVPKSRRESGYRVYDEDSLARLRFIKRAQDLGFKLEEIKELLGLRSSSTTSRERARNKAKTKLLEVQSKISYLKHLETTLKRLINDCEHHRPSGNCPILEMMEGKF
jgi:DNA-binding transcriptional MerR regulator